MPVIKLKPKTTVGLVSSAAPSIDSHTMSDAEFWAMVEKDRKALKDQIDRHTTAAMLGISIRTLQRWHHENYGPKRRRSLRLRTCYSKAEVEAWIAEHGQGSHQPHSATKPSEI
jgi:hypothetical protein